MCLGPSASAVNPHMHTTARTGCNVVDHLLALRWELNWAELEVAQDRRQQKLCLLGLTCKIIRIMKCRKNTSKRKKERQPTVGSLLLNSKQDISVKSQDYLIHSSSHKSSLGIGVQ